MDEEVYFLLVMGYKNYWFNEVIVLVICYEIFIVEYVVVVVVNIVEIYLVSVVKFEWGIVFVY